MILSDLHGHKLEDTIAMMFNGYWQLPASPGKYTISVGGLKSKRIYSELEYFVYVSSFVPSDIRLTLKHRPGMENVQVYNVSTSSSLNSSRVDVFTVASGHLYERLMKIMMISVRRQTVYNTTFWIVKNFLSPQFKASLPILSKKYNFSYNLVSYKWPRWVYPQQKKTTNYLGE